MGADLDLFQTAEVAVGAVVCALSNGTFDAAVLVTVHNKLLLVWNVLILPRHAELMLSEFYRFLASKSFCFKLPSICRSSVSAAARLALPSC